MIFLGLGVLLLSLLLRENAGSHTGTAHIYTLTVQFVEITLVLPPLLPPPPSAAALLSLNPAKKSPQRSDIPEPCKKSPQRSDN